MKSYIIDGNNLIGKIKSLKQLHRKNKQQSAEKLAFILSRYFRGKKVSVSLHFDGYQSNPINVPGLKIIYSGKITADDKIKNEIGKSKNPKNINLVTSDNNLADFGRVCSCHLIKSEIFGKYLLSPDRFDEEQVKIEEINSTAEFKKLFGVRNK